MIEFIKTHFVEIAAVILGLIILTKVKRVLRKFIATLLAVATIARVLILLMHMK
jgi:hypothetical protein